MHCFPLKVLTEIWNMECTFHLQDWEVLEQNVHFRGIMCGEDQRDK
jgi:hypothetical protein